MRVFWFFLTVRMKKVINLHFFSEIIQLSYYWWFLKNQLSWLISLQELLFIFLFLQHIKYSQRRISLFPTVENYQAVPANLVKTETQNKDQEYRRRKIYTVILIGNIIKVKTNKIKDHWYFCLQLRFDIKSQLNLPIDCRTNYK